MTTATHSEREQFVAELIRLLPKSEARHAQRLMRYASGYWFLMERQQKDFLAISDRDRMKLVRIKHAVSDICREVGAEPCFGQALHIMVETKLANKIVRVPCV